MMKVKGIAIVKQSFEVELDITSDLFEGFSMRKQNEMIENAIDFKNTSIESIEIDDDIDFSD